MKSLEKRLLKLEKVVKTKYNHSGVFFVFINNDIYTLQNYDDKGKCFDSKQKLEDYIYSKYDAEKYVFLTFDTSNLKRN